MAPPFLFGVSGYIRAKETVFYGMPCSGNCACSFYRDDDLVVP